MSEGKTRPTAALIIGIINIVWGVIGTCGGIGMFFFLSLLAKSGRAELPPEVESILKMNQAANIGLTIILIVGGIGLIKFKNWGRILSFVYAGAYVPLSIWGASLAPQIRQAMKSFLPSSDAPPQLEALTSVAGTALNLCCGLIYPIVLLVVLNLKSVREAFTQSANVPPTVT